MPNGGVPLHMVLRPRGGERYVFYCGGDALHLIAADEWEKQHADAAPLFSLNAAELRVMAAFVRYWSGETDSGLIYSLPGVNVEFDW
jgi:hypothetical protein